MTTTQTVNRDQELELLDNPIYNALRTSHAEFAMGDDLAKRYPPDFTCLAGLRDESAESFESLKTVTAGGTVRILTANDKFVLPNGWTCKSSYAVTQMTCPALIHCPEVVFETLKASDVPAMMELAELAQPGPFYDRTIDLGTFVGVRDGEKLVAMAGQRMQLPGYEEITAVSTHPDYRGRGYARALVFALANAIRERGNIPFLTVKPENIAGIRSYESIGFKPRRLLRFLFISAS